MQILAVRGTTERPGPNGTAGGLLAGLAPHLAPEHTLLDVPYPASIGPANPELNPRTGVSMEASVDAGVRALLERVSRAHEPVGLVGYSLGAMVISRYLEVIHEYRSPQVNMIAFAGLVANPRRAEGDSHDRKAQGWGIAGQHGPWPAWVPTIEIANPADVICSCPPNSPLRYLADLMTFASATDLGLWKQDVVRTFQNGEWQTGVRPSARDCAAAVTGLWNYLFGGAHIGAYTMRAPGGSMLEQLADWVNVTSRAAAA